jgi:hypothetical protein
MVFFWIQSPLLFWYLYTHVWPSSESLVNYVALLGVEADQPVFDYGEWKFQAEKWQKILTLFINSKFPQPPHKQWICIVNYTFIGSVLFCMLYMMVSRPGSLGEMCLVNWIFVWLVNWTSFIDPSNVPGVRWLTGCLIMFDECCPFDPFCAVCGWCRTVSHKGYMCTSVM